MFYKLPEEKSLELLELLRNRRSNEELCNALNIDRKQLHELLLDLKINGVSTVNTYFSDGSIKYRCLQHLSALKTSYNTDKIIITDSKEDILRVLIISDLHMGNILERIDLINKAFDYCIKRGINIILCGGDMIDGTYSRTEQRIPNIYEQIEYFLENYPYDKNILTFSVAGDHEVSALRDKGINIIEICKNNRHDIIYGGFNNMVVNIKNDKLLLTHYVLGGTQRRTDAPIILNGHYHEYSLIKRDDVLYMKLPTLSDIHKEYLNAVEMELYFKQGLIESTIIRNVHLGEQDEIMHESQITLRDNIQNQSLLNVEQFKDKEQLLKL